MVRFFNVCLWLSAVSIFCFVWGFLIEPKTFKVREHTVDVRLWDQTPLKIVFLSDLHIAGKHVPAKRVSKIVQTINAQSPDIVLMGGDFVDGSGKRAERKPEFINELDKGLAHLADIKSKYGTYTVLGNHDAHHGNQALRTILERHNLIVMENETAIIDNRFCVTGYGDEWYGFPEYEAAANCPVDYPLIGLMHNPDTFALLPNNAVLGLAGHTHGGQINLPILGRAVTLTDLGSKYAYGLKFYRGQDVYITSGIGTSQLSARFRSPPEIAIITLQ